MAKKTVHPAYAETITAEQAFTRNFPHAFDNVRTIIGAVFKDVAGGELPPCAVANLDNVAGYIETQAIMQPIKLFDRIYVKARYCLNNGSDESIVATIRLTYSWEHFGGGTNGSDIAMIWILADGNVKYRNYLTNGNGQNEIHDLGINE